MNRNGTTTSLPNKNSFDESGDTLFSFTIFELHQTRTALVHAIRRNTWLIRSLQAFHQKYTQNKKCLFINKIMPFSMPPSHPGAGTALISANAIKSTVSCGQSNSDRQKFLLFIKIFFKYIEKTKMESIRRRAKAIIAECTYRNRQGDPEYMPLQDSIERRLRECVGEIHWSRALRCYEVFCARRFWKVYQPHRMEAV